MSDLSHLQFIAISFNDGSVGIMAFNLKPTFNHNTAKLRGL